ncbi:MAG: ATP-binding protein [Hyphomicrobiales bacterium]
MTLHRAQPGPDLADRLPVDPGAASVTEALAWLRTALTSYIDGGERIGTDRFPAPAPLVDLAARFGLSGFEQQLLFFGAAPDLDPGMAELYALAQGNGTSCYATFGLASTLWPDLGWDVLSPHRPLRHWHLVQITQLANRPQSLSPLYADERVVNYLKGLNEIDGRLRPFVLRADPGEGRGLSASQLERVDRGVGLIDHAAKGRGATVLQLVGSDAISKRMAAAHIAGQLGLRLYRLPAQLIPQAPHELDDLARLWHRESLLLPVALMIDTSDIDLDGANGMVTRLAQFLARTGGTILLGLREISTTLPGSELTVDMHKPSRAEQRQAWETVLGPGSPDAAALAAHFHLNPPTISDIARRASRAEVEDLPLADRLWEAGLAYTRPALDALAQRIQPKARWEDIVLPEPQLKLLRHIVEQVGWRGTVYDEWGFRSRSSRGLGTVVLFAGESGTGKTMAAEILANELRLNLYRIDLSAVVSKYIGETEKNLRKLFDAAEDGGALLFFDEADALFGKRSEVKDSHDRYANIEVNYLLQRLESYEGLAILATNFKSGLDPAFTRRLRISITFEPPGDEQGRRIWEKVFPAGTPMGNLDYDYLSSTFRLTGGSIYNAALNASFIAAAAGEPVGMDHVLEAIRMELIKEDRLLDEDEFAWPGGVA